jgi:ankyrin repeat protein
MSCPFSGDVEVQQANLGSQNAKLVLNAVASACRDAAGSDGILLEAEIAGRNISSKGAVLDTTPPGYTASDDPPPAFEESSDFAYAKAGFTKADAGSSSNHHNKGSSDGFLRSLAGPFKAATAALRSKPEPLVVALCQAATNGNVAQIRSLLAEGANINGRNESGQTALICAIHAGQLDAVKVLLDAGADHARRDAGSKGNPPLIHAIQAGNRPAAELLLKHGADPNQKDEWGETYVIPLITGDTAPEWIALLLSHGADPSAKDMSGRPLAVLAIQKRKRLEDREEVVRLLLQHGAKPDSSDMDGTPLIHICLQQKRSGLAHELLAKGANPNARDVSGISLLAAAIKNSDRDLARAVLDRGADPNAPDIYGSPLLLNVLRDSKFPGADREALAEMLLEHGARGGEKDLYGVTALEHSLAPIVQGITAVPSFSAGYTKLKIPELLLQRGADPNQCLTKVSGEPRVLAYAVERGLWDLAALVLRHGANANAVDKKGRTPLVQAVQAGNVEAVALLIQHGANVNLPGPTLPLDVAMGTGESEIVDLLKAHGAGSSGNAA